MQAFEEKHTLNAIDHAAIERLCCSSIQLTVFKSLVLEGLRLDEFSNEILKENWRLFYNL